MSSIKDSGSRQEFDTGAVRDIRIGKGRYDLLPLYEVSLLLEEPIMTLSDDVKTYSVILNTFDDILDNSYQSDGTKFNALIRVLAVFIDNEYDENRNFAIKLLAEHFEAGAEKYGDNNWRKGIPLRRYMDSALRHYFKYLSNFTDESHATAFMWNVICAAWTIRNKPELIDLRSDN